LIDLLYSQIARARRRYYQRRPHLRRRLTAPVISIGNLTVGGSGKTPLTGEIARMLIGLGERPAILSRGYGRSSPVEGAVVVSDGRSVKADVARAGDEPLMLTQIVPGAVVVVCADRYLAGRLAESQLGCTVHLLDDGFQHFRLERDVNLLVAPLEDFVDARTLPFGRLREPIDVASAADALLVPSDNDAGAATTMSARLGVTPAFSFSRRVGGPGSASASRVFAFAGIAKPRQFFAELEQAGWQIAGTRAFRDHHQYLPREIAGLAEAARAAGAEGLVTTSKDAVRLGEPHRAAAGGLTIVEVPLHISIEPAFQPWLSERLSKARAA
jgi:tetraacyldisaccharide 4'-kinase